MHLKNKHPDVSNADGLVLKCSKCSFKTVSSNIYESHISKHTDDPKRSAKEETINETLEGQSSS